MKKTFTLLLAGAVLMAIAGTASAETGKMYIPHKHTSFHDVVRDSSGKPVRTHSGDCVRTQWMNSYDACPSLEAPPAISREERTVYFPFNKATLTAEAKHKLDSLAATLQARSIRSVRVAGFADRIGGAVYNEKLSKKRADAVRKYLVKKGVVNAQVVETRWFGDSVPATNCPKDMPRKELIACLQKDRRVEVEVDTSPMPPPPVPMGPVPSRPE